MEEQDKKNLMNVITAAVPDIKDEAMNIILTYIVNFERKRADHISLQNIGIIAANALRKKSYKPEDILGAVTLHQMQNGGVDVDTLKFLAPEMGAQGAYWLKQQSIKEQADAVQT